MAKKQFSPLEQASQDIKTRYRSPYKFDYIGKLREAIGRDITPVLVLGTGPFKPNETTSRALPALHGYTTKRMEEIG